MRTPSRDKFEAAGGLLDLGAVAEEDGRAETESEANWRAACRTRGSAPSGKTTRLGCRCSFFNHSADESHDPLLSRGPRKVQMFLAEESAGGPAAAFRSASPEVVGGPRPANPFRAAPGAGCPWTPHPPTSSSPSPSAAPTSRPALYFP